MNEENLNNDIDELDDTECFVPFRKLKPNPKAIKPTGDLLQICAEIQDMQRKKVRYMKGRIKTLNVMTSAASLELGYEPTDDAKERQRIMAETRAVIKDVCAGEPATLEPYVLELILRGSESHDVFGHTERRFLNQMNAHVRYLGTKLKPELGEWIKDPEQFGFGWPSLATVIGESTVIDREKGTIYTLSDYPGPASVWKRFGCWPYTKNGITRMISTWARFHKSEITNEEWTNDIKYCRRRHSIAWGIGKSLNMKNAGNPENIYRARYLKAKREVIENRPTWHWNVCSCCKDTGKPPKPDCDLCFGTGRTSQQANYHSLTMVAKLALKRLWRVWNNNYDDPWQDGQARPEPAPRGYIPDAPKTAKKAVKETGKKATKKAAKKTTKKATKKVAKKKAVRA